MNPHDAPNTAYLYPVNGSERAYELKRHNELGSSPSNQIVVGDSSIAAFHAHIFLRDSNWILKDLSSPMGSSVNGVRVKEAHLRDQDHLRLGRINFLFSLSPLELNRPTSKNPQWDEKLKNLRNFAASDSTVLISGESGTGKEVGEDI